MFLSFSRIVLDPAWCDTTNCRLLPTLSGPGESLRLYYGVQKLSHLLFSELIQRCQAELGCFHCTRWVEDAAAASPGGTLGFKTGRLDVDAIAEECGVASVYYLSGPPQMITTFKDRLRERGVPAPGIKVDEWE